MVFSLGTFPRGAFVALDGLHVGISLPAEPTRNCWPSGLSEGHFACLRCARSKSMQGVQGRLIFQWISCTLKFEPPEYSHNW